MGALRLDQGPHHERRRQPAGGLGGGHAEDRPPLRLPQIPGLRRDQRHARPACPDPPRSRPQGHGGPRQARPRRHSRNRVHGPGLPADSRRPRSGAADPPDPASPFAARRTQADFGGHRARTERRLCFSAPTRASPAVRRGQADAHAPDGSRRTRKNRPQHGLCRLGGHGRGAGQASRHCQPAL
ncbi:hypothetical protein SDC9_194513 [bioreactor metagenome]|uniref:Uncharacterized protein n=1 Tax=bioreactor metagenome TaxID=1076179 RepID=A0A645IF31_9ZZZZ